MIYIGNFLYVSNQGTATEADRRHGDFTLIVEAESSSNAIDMFRDRISDYKQGNRFFDGACKFFFVNLKSYAGDPVLPFIECAIPSEESDGCKISDWSANIPQIDGQNERVFLEFSE
ncbi:hypothetical protein D3OALGA1CA_4742 [Olavius algarvensis associated proteobacterium Delta 3]|nr:hypothetical protein D3OALGA1CA_4742 [Olavius algarvensis associated proteobacterium Delta 3]